MMIDNYKVGARIALLRRVKCLTGEQFAELLDVSPQAVSKWENGKNLPETALLLRIAEALGASIDSILKPVPDETEKGDLCVREAYVYIPVSDIDRACEWYERTLRLKKSRVCSAFTELRGGGAGVILIPVDTSQNPVPHPQMSYRGMAQVSFGFTVRNYEAVREWLQKTGAELTETINYGRLSCKFYDPTATLLRFGSTARYQNQKSPPTIFRTALRLRLHA
ncbi:MAG: helix-turn-helix domain-containing protein [Oscillospiraceae bacterium]|jgi:transcriptional regulator with XRE-family HTH domain|nr:helix-turn-helix domain-containing protein [Oscillospiraceae bacterium]